MKDQLPSGRMIVLYDQKTGVINRTFRGTNVIVEPEDGDWGEVTEDANVLQMFSNDGQRQWLYCCKRNGLVKKARARLEVDTPTFEAANGETKVRLKIDSGDSSFMPGKVKVRINSKVVELAPDEEMTITSAVPNRLTVKVEDDRVFVPHDPPVVVATPMRRQATKETT